MQAYGKMCDQKKGRNIKNKTQQPSKHPRPRTVGMAVHLLSVPTAPPCNMYYICLHTVSFRFFASLRLYLQFPAYFYLYSMSFSCIRKKSFRTSFWRAEYHSSPRMTLIPPFPGVGTIRLFLLWPSSASLYSLPCIPDHRLGNAAPVLSSPLHSQNLWGLAWVCFTFASWVVLREPPTTPKSGNIFKTSGTFGQTCSDTSFRKVPDSKHLC